MHNEFLKIINKSKLLCLTNFQVRFINLNHYKVITIKCKQLKCQFINMVCFSNTKRNILLLIKNAMINQNKKNNRSLTHTFQQQDLPKIM